MSRHKSFSFGKRLKMARVEKDLSQSELAKLIGCTQPSLCDYENDIIKPRISRLKKIAQILKKSFNYFLE